MLLDRRIGIKMGSPDAYFSTPVLLEKFDHPPGSIACDVFVVDITTVRLVGLVPPVGGARKDMPGYRLAGIL
jgi:hypothetical protein